MGAVYFAKWILLDSGEILVNGAIAVKGNVITSIGPRSRVKRTSEDRSVNLGEVLMIPGLINMHTHLEEGIVRGLQKDADETFAGWSAKKDSRVRQSTPTQLALAMQLTIRELLAEGITTVVDSSRSGISADVLAGEPIRSWVIQEIHEFELDAEENSMSAAENLVRSCPGKIGKGIGPHAIYSLSPRSQRHLIDLARNENWLWATHLAESSEELQAFSELSGDLYFQITHKRPWQFGEKSPGPLYQAITSNSIPNGGVCFHCNYATGHEFSLLAARKISIVLCYQYGQFLGHKEFPLDVALNRGVSICLGTEGIAAAGFMSLFDELFALKSAYPHITAPQMLKWVTQNPANALKMGHMLGSLTPGKLADMIAVRFAHDPAEDLLEELLVEEPEIKMAMIDGEEVIMNY